MSSPPSTVSVWYAGIAWLEDAALRQRCLALLDPTERAAHARFMVPRAQDAYLLAHALCRVALSHHGSAAPDAWRFAPTSRGKPAIVAPAEARVLHFNISHGRSMVAVVVSPEHPVGVDVEDAQRAIDIDKLGPRVLTPREYQACTQHSAPGEHFLRHWTLKEAYLKAQGEGISEQLSAIDMRVDGADASVMVTDARPRAPSGPWHVRLMPAQPDHTGCIIAAAVRASWQASRFVWSDASALLRM